MIDMTAPMRAAMEVSTPAFVPSRRSKTSMAGLLNSVRPVTVMYKIAISDKNTIDGSANCILGRNARNVENGACESQTSEYSTMSTDR